MGAAQEIAAILEGARADIVEDVVALQRSVVSRYEEVALDDHRASVAPVIAGLAHLLRGAPAGDLIAVVRDASRTRRRLGFTSAELSSLVHTYLPPMRRALLRARGVEAGLALYETLEERVLQVYPLIHARILADDAR